MQTKYKWLSETEPVNHFKNIAKTIKTEILEKNGIQKHRRKELLWFGFK